MFGLASSMPNDTFYVTNRIIGREPKGDLSISNGYWRWLRCIKPKPVNVKLLGESMKEIDVDDYDVAILIPDAGQIEVWEKYLQDIPIVWKFHLCNTVVKELLAKHGSKLIGDYPCIYSAESQKEFYGMKGKIAWSQDPEIYNGWTGEVKKAMWTCERIGIPNQNDARYMERGGFIWDKIHPFTHSKRYGLDFRLGTPITTFEEMIVAYKLNRCYLECATGTILTDGLIEAMMSGMPPVVYASWEMDRIIEHGVNGFKSTNPTEMINYVNNLLEDHDLAKEMGKEARKTALKLWSPEISREAYHEACLEAIRQYNKQGRRRKNTLQLFQLYSIKSHSTSVDDFLFEMSKRKITELKSDFEKEFCNVVTCSHCLKKFELKHVKGTHIVKPVDDGEYVEVG
jgi:hypothetical protein